MRAQTYADDIAKREQQKREKEENERLEREEKERKNTAGEEQRAVSGKGIDALDDNIIRAESSVKLNFESSMSFDDENDGAGRPRTAVSKSGRKSPPFQVTYACVVCFTHIHV